MDLLQHLVDVDAVAFLPLALLLLIALGDGLLGLTGLLGGLSGGFGWHDACAQSHVNERLMPRFMREPLYNGGVACKRCGVKKVVFDWFVVASCESCVGYIRVWFCIRG